MAPAPRTILGSARRIDSEEGDNIVSMNSRVYDMVKERILSNQFGAGYKLNHQELAELFSVSRTPIREALERLYQEGFVIHIPNRGFFVAQIDEDEARQLFELREGLELHALQLSLRRGAKFDLRKSRMINKEYRLAVQGNHAKRRMSLDRDFHLSLAAHSGNEHLLRSLNGIFERIMFKLRVDSYPSLPSVAYREHVDILQALTAEDFSRASDLLAMHIRAGFGRILGQIR